MYITAPFQKAADLPLPEQEAFLRGWWPDESETDLESQYSFQDMLNFCHAMSMLDLPRFSDELEIGAYTIFAWTKGIDTPPSESRLGIISLAIDTALNRRP